MFAFGKQEEVSRIKSTNDFLFPDGILKNIHDVLGKREKII